ncbi:MAG: hypothetical protein RIR54_928, partial [Actinomycetota bacterium]
DSDATIDAAALAGLRNVLIDVNIGLPRCGCAPHDAGRLADLARSRGLTVRGVMGYEGHLMVSDDRAAQQRETLSAMQQLHEAATSVGGDIVSAGGTGNHDVHARHRNDTGVTEVQAGSYALMDTYYSTLGLPFRQALGILGTVVSTHEKWARSGRSPTLDSRASAWTTAIRRSPATRCGSVPTNTSHSRQRK